MNTSEPTNCFTHFLFDEYERLINEKNVKDFDQLYNSFKSSYELKFREILSKDNVILMITANEDYIAKIKKVDNLSRFLDFIYILRREFNLFESKSFFEPPASPKSSSLEMVGNNSLYFERSKKAPALIQSI